ncbi:MAG: RDD family protein [Moraxellaceae bacterium]|nr:MAG: RDD family protein [Moraxellaceae bacterium]
MHATSNRPTPPRSAPLWRRFAALGYDSLILMALSMGYGALITSVKVAFGAPEQDYRPMLHSPVYFIGWMAVLIGFYLYSWCRSGQTIGMRSWRIQLIPQDPNAKLVSLKQALWRCLFGSLGLVFMGAGYWYRLFNREGNTWQDLMTQTQVVLIPKH